MKSKVVKVNPKTTLIGGILLVSGMLIWIVSIPFAWFTYTVFPFKPQPVSWLPYPIPVINFGHSPWYQAVSELGIGPSAYIFTVGVIIGSFLVVIGIPILLGLLKNTRLAKITVISLEITFISLIGAGIYPMVLSPLHNIFALIVFPFMAVSAITLSYQVIKDTFFPKAIAWLGFSLIVVDVIFFIAGFILMHSASYPLEWLDFFVGAIWILAIGIVMILKRNVTEV